MYLLRPINQLRSINEIIFSIFARLNSEVQTYVLAALSSAQDYLSSEYEKPLYTHTRMIVPGIT